MTYVREDNGVFCIIICALIAVGVVVACNVVPMFRRAADYSPAVSSPEVRETIDKARANGDLGRLGGWRP